MRPSKRPHPTRACISEVTGSQKSTRVPWVRLLSSRSGCQENHLNTGWPKEGFTPVEGAWHRWFPKLSIILDEEQSVPSGMVRAGGQTELFITGLEHLDPGPLGDYWIDKHEVTTSNSRSSLTKVVIRRTSTGYTSS